MAITVKNDTSGQAVGAIGISSGIDKNRAYGLNLDQQELQRQQLAQQEKASAQRFQEYKDRLIREDKMNEREAEIKARTMEAAARESEANLSMQKERLDLDRANSEAVAGRADASLGMQQQQLNQNSNANQMALHQQKLSYTQEAENAKIDESLRRIQSDVASGRLSRVAGDEMTRQLNDKRYGTNTEKEEPTPQELYNQNTFVNENGVRLGMDSSGKYYDIESVAKQKEAEIQIKQEELKQKQDEIKQKLQEKKIEMAMKMVEGSVNPETGVATKTIAAAMQELSGFFGETNTQSVGAADPKAAKVLSVAGMSNEGKIQTGTPETENVQQVFETVVKPLYTLDSSGNQNPVSPEVEDANFRQYLLTASKAGIGLKDATMYYDQNVDKAKPAQKQAETTSFKNIDMANPEDAKRAEYGYATYVKEQERAGTDPKLILPYEDWLLEMDKNPELFDKNYNKKIDYSSKERQAKQTAAGNAAMPLGFLLTK